LSSRWVGKTRGAILPVRSATGLVFPWLQWSSLALWCVVFAAPRPCESADGLASWYGGGETLHEYTACGSRFEPGRLATAAWEFPCGTRLRVCSLRTGRCVEVVVDDRGPNRRTGRVLDLTRRAFSRIEELSVGVTRVSYEPIYQRGVSHVAVRGVQASETTSVLGVRLGARRGGRARSGEPDGVHEHGGLADQLAQGVVR